MRESRCELARRSAAREAESRCAPAIEQGAFSVRCRGARGLGGGGVARSPETAGPSHRPNTEPGTRWLEAC